MLLLTGSNEPVGVVKGVQALAQLLCAIPAGCAADLLRRDRMLAVAGVVGAIAAVLTGVALQLAFLPLIYTSFALWGVFMALCNPALDALFADSVPAGQRSMPFMLKHVMLNVALVIGPFCAILLLWKYGDTWELDSLRPVFLFGAFLAAASMGILFHFNDDFAYENRQRVMAVERELWSIERHFSPEFSDVVNPEGVDSDGATPVPSFSPNSLCAATFPSEFSRLLQSPTAMSGGYKSPHSAIMECVSDVPDVDITDSDLPPARPISICCGMLNTSHVPYLLFVSDFVVSNGTGLAASFFPLFLIKEFALSPINIQTLFVLQPMCVALCSLFTQLFSTCTGRMPMIVASRAVGTMSLAGIVVSEQVEVHCALFLAREAFMQCTNPLRQSLLMDFVSKEYRARWNSLEGLSMFSWAGSAVLGGFIVDAYGYRTCFFAATAVYTCGVLLEILLIPLTRHIARQNIDDGKS